MSNNRRNRLNNAINGAPNNPNPIQNANPNNIPLPLNIPAPIPLPNANQNQGNNPNPAPNNIPVPIVPNPQVNNPNIPNNIPNPVIPNPQVNNPNIPNNIPLPLNIPAPIPLPNANQNQGNNPNPAPNNIPVPIVPNPQVNNPNIIQIPIPNPVNNPNIPNNIPAPQQLPNANPNPGNPGGNNPRGNNPPPAPNNPNPGNNPANPQVPANPAAPAKQAISVNCYDIFEDFNNIYRIVGAVTEAAAQSKDKELDPKSYFLEIGKYLIQTNKGHNLQLKPIYKGLGSVSLGKVTQEQALQAGAEFVEGIDKFIKDPDYKKAADEAKKLLATPEVRSMLEIMISNTYMKKEDLKKLSDIDVYTRALFGINPNVSDATNSTELGKRIINMIDSGYGAKPKANPAAIANNAQAAPVASP